MSAPPTRSLSPTDRSRLFLVLSGLLTVVLYVVPYGDVIGRPLVWLSTLAHELGHGIAALCIGGSFEEFNLWPDGSGVARWRGAPGRLGRAFVSAGGLVGPALVAGLGFWMGRDARSARGLLGFFGVALAIALLLVVRGWFGLLFVGAVAAGSLALAFKAKPWASQVTVVFLSVQLALSVFSRGDYLFTAEARTAGGTMPSDVAQMAEALWLPYWFWGAACGAISVAVLVLGLRAFFKESPADPASRAGPRG